MTGAIPNGPSPSISARPRFGKQLDAIALAGNARAVFSDREGAVRLVARRPGERSPPTSYDGDFRTRVLRTQRKS